MGCRKLSYYQEEGLEKNTFFSVVGSEKRETEHFFGIDYYPYGKILREWNPTSEMFKYQGSQEDQELGTGSYYTHNRGLDVDIVRWKQIDPAITYGSPYMSMSGNPIMFNDALGDSSIYFNSAGNQIYVSHDGLENGVFTVSDDKIDMFNYLIGVQKSLGGKIDGDGNEFNSLLRKQGTGYAVDEFKGFYNENQDDNTSYGYTNEHKTYLYEKNGLIRIGSENIPGDPSGVSGGKTNERGSVGHLHTHPNAGKSVGNGGTFTHRPSGTDYKMPKDHSDIVISNKYIYFINNNNSKSFSVKFNNTFSKSSNSSKGFNE